MRTLSALLMVLLLCSLQQVYGGPQSLNFPTECCFEFMKVKIPFRRIVSYRVTSSSCPKQAVIFKTIARRNFCVDPEDAWVQKHMKKLQPSN